MQQIIKVSGIKVRGYHGCLPEETQIGGNYTVDVEMNTDFSKSFETDALEDTIDYALIYKIVKDEMAIPSKLIEHVGHRIFERITSEVKHTLHNVMVRVIKHNPPMNGQIRDVEIEISL